MPPSNSSEPQRIAKLLARAGVASRRDVERLIAAGRVAIDGQTVETPATLLVTLKGVTVDGRPVQAPEPTRLFRFHKSAGFLTAARDPAGRRTIYDQLPADLPRLMPVGRLDLNTEGLLLLTTDGEFKRQLELPATAVERTYRARAFGEVSQAQLEDLMLGIEIEGVRYGPINANMERRTGANAWIEMTLTEGKNREVRRVLEHLGLEVSRLIRTRYGPFYLEDLPMGSVDEIKQHELVEFRKSLGSKPTSKPKPEGADPEALKAWRREPSRAGAPRPRPQPVEGEDRPEREIQPHPQAFERPRPDPVERPIRETRTPTGRKPLAAPGRRPSANEPDAPRNARGRRAAAFAERSGRDEPQQKPAAPRGRQAAAEGAPERARPAPRGSADRARPRPERGPASASARGRDAETPRGARPHRAASGGPKTPRGRPPEAGRDAERPHNPRGERPVGDRARIERQNPQAGDRRKLSPNYGGPRDAERKPAREGAARPHKGAPAPSRGRADGDRKPPRGAGGPSAGPRGPRPPRKPR